MQSEKNISIDPWLSGAVVYIGSTYSGTTVRLASLLPAGLQAVTIVIERGVHVTFTDNYLSSVDIKFECQQGSRVIYLLELLSQPVSRVKAHVAWHVSEKSTVECVLMGTIARSQVIMDMDIYLHGTQARGSLHALIIVDQEAQCVMRSRQIHTACYTTSIVRVHSVVGAAHMDYRGAIDIERGSVDAKAIQANKNILLSRAGKIVAIPTLQVRTNQVNCTHGAAVGNLEAEHIAYLQARGIDAQRARILLLHGFLVSALEGASEESRCFVRQTIATMMQTMMCNNSTGN